MIVKPPQTIEDFENVKKTILELLENPYCDKSMRSTLNKKLEKVNLKIKELSVS